MGKCEELGGSARRYVRKRVMHCEGKCVRNRVGYYVEN